MTTRLNTCCWRFAKRARWLRKSQAAGAVFLGHWSPESMGDYCSGPNHTLPTYGYARAYSGLSTRGLSKAHHRARIDAARA